MDAIVKNWEAYTKLLTESLNLIDPIPLKHLSDILENYLGSKSEVHLLGNGGSAANCAHITGDYTKTFSLYSTFIRMSSLSDNACYLTAVSNDLDYSEVFSLLIPGRIKKDDIVIFLSGSGNSMNLVKCAYKAKSNNIKTASVTGYNAGELGKVCDLSLHIPVNDMEKVEDIQLVLFHFIKQELCRRLEKKGITPQYAPRYDKRVDSGEIA